MRTAIRALRWARDGRARGRVPGTERLGVARPGRCWPCQPGGGQVLRDPRSHPLAHHFGPPPVGQLRRHDHHDAGQTRHPRPDRRSAGRLRSAGCRSEPRSIDEPNWSTWTARSSASAPIRRPRNKKTERGSWPPRTTLPRAKLAVSTNDLIAPVAAEKNTLTLAAVRREARTTASDVSVAARSRRGRSAHPRDPPRASRTRPAVRGTERHEDAGPRPVLRARRRQDHVPARPGRGRSRSWKAMRSGPALPIIDAR